MASHSPLPTMKIRSMKPLKLPPLTPDDRDSSAPTSSPATDTQKCQRPELIGTSTCVSGSHSGSANSDPWASSIARSAPAPFPEIALGDWKSDEIGRASCRERVCQYV